MINVMNDKLETKALLERARGGDRDAFDTIVGEYRDRLSVLIRARRQALGAGMLDPEDLLQDTLLRAFDAIDRFEWRGEDSFMRWLGGIAENVILNARRQAMRRRTTALEHDLARSQASPSRAMRRDERFDRLQDALAALSPEHREVIRLARIEGLTMKEIGERMNRSANAVSQLLWRALDRLKDAFGETESFHLPDRKIGEGRDDDD